MGHQPKGKKAINPNTRNASNNKESFWRKNVIALIALCVSAASFYVAFINYKRQDAEWKAINQPRFDVTDPKFVPYVVLDEEPQSGFFAKCYDPLIRTSEDPYTYSNGKLLTKYRVLSELMLWDDTKGGRILGSKSLQSDQDITDEVARLQLKDYQVVKHYSVEFVLKNLGQVAATNIETSPVVRIDTEATPLKKRRLNSIEGQRQINERIEWYAPVCAKVPGEIKVSYSISYDYAGERHTSDVKSFSFTEAKGWTIE